MSEIPKPYEIYQHFKGNRYQVVVVAEHSETGEIQIVYQGLQEPYKIYVRPLSMFHEKINKQEYSQATQELRFEKVVKESKTEKFVSDEEKISEKSLPDFNESNSFDSEELLEPLLLDFLDSDTYEEKLNILAALQHRITEETLNTMAMALDVELNEGKLQEKYDSLRNCLVTLQRYECNRLR